MSTFTSTLVAGAAETLDRRRGQDDLEIVVGAEWMTHKELAALGSYPHTDCEGTVRFVDVRRPIKEAACDGDGCHFTVTGRESAIRQSRQGREERWYQR